MTHWYSEGKESLSPPPEASRSGSGAPCPFVFARTEKRKGREKKKRRMRVGKPKNALEWVFWANICRSLLKFLFFFFIQ
jgi:hypothetical protein